MLVGRSFSTGVHGQSPAKGSLPLITVLRTKSSGEQISADLPVEEFKRSLAIFFAFGFGFGPALTDETLLA